MRKKFAGCVLANKPRALIRLRLCGSWPGIFTTPSLISIHTIIHIGHNNHICREYMELHAGKIYTHSTALPNAQSGGRLREMTWWSQTKFFRDHLYHCYGFYLDRLDTPSSFSLISENQLIFCFSAIFDTKFSRYHRFEGTSSLSSVFVQLNSVSSVKKLWKN